MLGEQLNIALAELHHMGAQSVLREQAQVRSADMYSFMLWQMGEPGFQPR